MEGSENGFAGKVVVVTGGSRGLGRAMAEALARRGAITVIASRDEAACVALAAGLEAETGNLSLGLGFHAGRWDHADLLHQQVLDRFGRCDVLINNAGMSALYDSLVGVSEELFDKVLAVNLRGPFRLSALFGESMASGSGGSIINVSSIAAVQPRPGEVVYAAAKAGLNNLTVALAQTYGPKVRCNAIMPGPFLTDISTAWDLQKFQQRAEESIPLRRGGQPEEVVGAVLYLASDAASYTTGAVIKIDGGAAYSPA